MNFKHAKLLFLILLGYFKRNKVLLSAIFIILLLTIAGVKFKIAASEDVVRIGLIGTYQEHDLPQEVTKLLSSGLVQTDKDGRIKPNLVSGWEVNNDATQFKFKLKEDIKWVDKTKVKAQDVGFNIPNTYISFPDERTVQFNLKEPYSPFPSLLLKPIFKKNSLLGTGPYKISKIEKSRIFITKMALEPQEPGLPRLSIRFYPAPQTAQIGFNLGEVQVLLGVPSSSGFSNNRLILINQKTDYSKIVTLLFQNSDSLLSNRSLRQALAYQIPKVAGQESANNPYPPFSWVYNSDAKKYFSNPHEAGAALERAKSSLPEDKLGAEIILTTIPSLEEVGKVIVDSWKELGFDSKLRVESGIPQNFQALLITQSIPTDPDQYFLWHATQTKTNLSKYDSKRADKDLEDGRKLIVEEERKAKYFDFQKTLLEDAPAAFLYFPKYNIVYLKKVETLLSKVLAL